jgi:AraC-like DNA-binding protein
VLRPLDAGRLRRSGSTREARIEQGNILQDRRRAGMVQLEARGGMHPKEWTRLWHNTRLDVGLLQAFYVHHAYPRHSHEYYVISLIERGRQSFTHNGTKHVTPEGGVILINPGEVHTGEAVDAQGFEMRSLYPAASHMEAAAFELTGRHQGLPFFTAVRVDHRWAKEKILALHRSLAEGMDALECESRFLWTLAQLIRRYAGLGGHERRPGREQAPVQRARRYIDERFAQGIRLDELAQHVSLSPYYLLRLFRAEVGMPPYAYLESVRIRHAQRLIETGKPLAEVALEVGFSSQSHLTRRFKQIIGVTPGTYARQIQS